MPVNFTVGLSYPFGYISGKFEIYYNFRLYNFFIFIDFKHHNIHLFKNITPSKLTLGYMQLQ